MPSMLSILTPEGNFFKDEIKDIIAPGIEGSFEVLPGHAPFISALKAGVIKVYSVNGTLQYFVVNQGLLEVRNDNIAILADHIEEAKDVVDAETKLSSLG